MYKLCLGVMGFQVLFVVISFKLKNLLMNVLFCILFKDTNESASTNGLHYWNILLGNVYDIGRSRNLAFSGA